jgi:hypothetical protein
MKRRVVDTNVAVVANGRNTNASFRCRRAAIDALASLLRRGRIVIDAGGEMTSEYEIYCYPRGQPGVGDRFFREVLMNYHGQKVERVALAKRTDGSFVDFPADPALDKFDLSDRKFAAAARKVAVQAMNATDSDWSHHRPTLSSNGIEVEFVCGINQAAWFVPSRSRRT